MLHPIGAKSQICMGELLGPFHDILCWSDGISSKPTQSPLLVWYSPHFSPLCFRLAVKYSPYALPCPYFEKSLEVHPLHLSIQFVIYSSCLFTLDPNIDLCLELWIWFWIFLHFLRSSLQRPPILFSHCSVCPASASSIAGREKLQFPPQLTFQYASKQKPWVINLRNLSSMLILQLSGYLIKLYVKLVIDRSLMKWLEDTSIV